MNTIRDVRQENLAFDSTYVERAVLKEVRMDSGSARVQFEVDEKYYYELLSELTGSDIPGEYELDVYKRQWPRLTACPVRPRRRRLRRRASWRSS